MSDDAPRLHVAVLGAPGDACAGCRSPLAVDQRHCLVCGARRGAPRVDFLGLLPGGVALTASAPPAVATPGVATLAARARPALPLALAVLVGLLVGEATQRTPATYAGGAQDLTVVLPPQPAPAPVALTPPVPAVPSLPAAPEVPVSDPAPAPAADVPPAPATTDEQEPAGEDEPAAQDDAPAEEDEPAAPERLEPKHVFLVVLHDLSADQLYGEATAVPYARELAFYGTLLPNHHAVTRGGAANLTALLGGVVPPAPDGPLPPEAGSVLEQTRGVERDWRAYVEDLAPDAPPCAATPYNIAARFPGIAADPAACAERARPLADFATDIAKPLVDQPALTFLTPGVRDAAGVEAFLRDVVPRILASEAYHDDGLLVITSDQSTPEDVEQGGHLPEGLNGGGRVGALLLGDDVPTQTMDVSATNHLDLSRTLSGVLDQPPLGLAADDAVTGIVLPEVRSTSSVDQPKPRAARP